MKILIIENDEKVGTRLKRTLEKRGFLADAAAPGDSAIARLDTYQNEYDVIVIDQVGLNKTGLNICSEIRLMGIQTPVLILTSHDDFQDSDLIAECGGNGSLSKPFSIEELHIKIEFLAAESEKNRATLEAGPVELHTQEKKVYVSGEEIPLTAKEINTLKYLMEHPNQVLSREQILHYIWGFDFKSISNVVDVHIKNIRKKLRDRKDNPMIETVWGFGYRFNPHASS